MRPLSFVFAVLALLPTAAQAQLFPRLFGGKQTSQVGSACPGGVCPTAMPPQASQQQTIANASLFPHFPMVASNFRSVGVGLNLSRSGTSWINRDGLSPRQHLEREHGTDTSGMTEAEVLAARDHYHNTYGAGHPVKESRSRSIGLTLTRSNTQQANYPAVASTVGYGSLGSLAVHSQATRIASGFGSAGSRVSGYGSAGGLSVGSLDHDGLVITSVSAPITMPSFTPTIQAALTPIVTQGPSVVPVPVVAAAVEVRASREFKQSLRGAITQARRDGKITIGEALELQTASYSPAFVRNAERLAVIQMVASGESQDSIPRTEDGKVDVAGINWGELGKFLQLVLPLLLEFLKGLGL